MKVDYSSVKGTSFGKFLGCAVQSEPTNIPDYDMGGLTIALTIDGKELDFQKVFSLFDRSIQGDICEKVETLIEAYKRDNPPQTEAPPPTNPPISGAPALISDLREAVNSAFVAAESNVQRFGDAVSSGCSVAARLAADHTRDAVNEACWEYGPSSNMNGQAIEIMNGVIARLQEASEETGGE